MERKKQRIENNAFLAEGTKVVTDLITSFHCILLAGTKEWFNKYPHIKAEEKYCINEDELKHISLMKTPQQVLAIFEQHQDNLLDLSIIDKVLCLGLDNVQNPGNLGTIIRLADWFGIEHIFCSLDSADIYNPKTVQATMGAMAHVQIHYTELTSVLSTLPYNIPIYGTTLDGNNIYREKLVQHGIIIMGNEGRGIRPDIEKYINKHLYIPNYPKGRHTTDSLNVAIATSIVCAEFRRQASY